MIKKTVTYTNYNDEEVTEDFFFNLTKAELVELELSEKDGLAETLQAIVKEEDGKQIVEYFKKIILMGYGEKSSDGRRFIKNEALREEFSQTEAFSELFIELATDAGAAATFINGLVPAKLVAEVEAQVAKEKAALEGTPIEPKSARDMSREELLEALREKNAG